jgi:hypothetical protein
MAHTSSVSTNLYMYTHTCINLESAQWHFKLQRAAATTTASHTYIHARMHTQVLKALNGTLDDSEQQLQQLPQTLTAGENLHVNINHHSGAANCSGGRYVHSCMNVCLH